MTRDQLCFRVVLCMLLISLFTYGSATGADIAPDAPIPVQLLPIVADQVVPSNQPPGTPYPLQPLDGVTDHDPVFVQFRWQSIDPDGDVLFYDVFFEADDPTPDKYLIRETGYQQIGAMLWGSTDYYWQVVSRDQKGGVSPSPVWYFRTAPCDDIWLNFEISGVQGLEITLDTRVSSRCSNLTKVEWHWGDGLVDSVDNPEAELSVSHTYSNTGLCNLEVIAYNDQGVSVSETLEIYRGPASGVCDYVTGIPGTECDALVSIYENMDGPNWPGLHGWNLFTTPCAEYRGWEGVECLDGHVDRLVLPYEYIKGDLPADIQDLTELHHFSLSGRFTSIPPELGNLSKLQTLGLSLSDIAELPPEIGNLGELTMLDLNDLGITHLPPEIGYLDKLTNLNLVGLDITHLPSTIGNLSNLDRLNIGHTTVTVLPAEIGDLTNLSYLNLDYNELTSLPDSIGNLHNLRTIEIRGNHLTSLPDTFSTQSALERLALGGNELVSIPDSICNPDHLGYLSISANPLSVLPDAIGQCKSLWYLSVSGSNVITLPASIGNLQNLTYLGAEHCALTGLPDEVSQLSSLRELNVSYNEITSLPEDISGLTSLYRLTAHNNALTTLPSSIGNLDGLAYIDVYSNALSSLPPEIGQITYLWRLDVQDNHGLTGPVPDYLTTLENMNALFFNDTNWCEPTIGPVADWLSALNYYEGTGIPCPEASAIQMCRVDG